MKIKTEIAKKNGLTYMKSHGITYVEGLGGKGCGRLCPRGGFVLECNCPENASLRTKVGGQ